MSINRYNYEEFFLLYADGELNPLEVEMVNQFVQLHPDLKEELDILMDCKLVADVPVFFPKEKLYKQTIWDTENVNETQSQLMLLLDNELTAKAKAALEKRIEENPLLQQEWNTLQQAKLPVEVIAHPYKKGLFKERKIPVLGWLRWAAAAAIIGAAWLLVDKNLKDDKANATTVLASNITAKQPQTQLLAPQAATTPETADGDDLDDGVEKGVTKEEPVPQPQDATGQANNVNEPSTGQSAAGTADSEPVDLIANAYNAQNESDNIDNYQSRTSLISDKATDGVEDMIIAKPLANKLKGPKISPLTASIINNKPSQSLTDLQNDADENEYVRIAGAKVKKQKIRSVFRGVFRGIGRTFSNSKVEAAPAMALNNE